MLMAVRKSSVATPSTVPVALPECWHETITRAEAMRRLKTRNLDKEKERRIAQSIPPTLEHYIVFGNGFREYIRADDAPARLLLMLPTRNRASSVWELPCPMLLAQRSRSGHARYFTTFELHRFEAQRGVLHEDGRALPSFKRVRGVVLPVDIEFLSAAPGIGHPGGSRCCDACEFVHSIFDIHDVDWLCCFFADGCGLIDI